MIANVCDISVGDFVHTLGDTHLYKNHFEQAKKQLSRSIKKVEIPVCCDETLSLDIKRLEKKLTLSKDKIFENFWKFLN